MPEINIPVKVSGNRLTADEINSIVDAVNAARSKIDFATKTADYTLTVDDAGYLIRMNVGTDNVLTVPTNADESFPIGTMVAVRQSGAGQTTITPDSGVTLNGSADLAQNAMVTLLKVGLNEWDIISGGTAEGTGGTGDVTAPTFVSATIEDAADTIIILTYNEALNTSSVPDLSDFEVLVNSGGTTIVNVSVTGSTVEIELDSPVVEADVITVSYTAGTNPIEDVAGNNAANLSVQAVTNNVVDSGGSIIDTITWHSRIDPAVDRTVRVAGADTFITSLLDQVPANSSAYDMVQATEANQPKYIASGINSLPSIEINTDKYLQTSTFPVNLTEPITRIAVLEFKTLPGGALAYALHAGSGDGCSLGFYTANAPFMFAGNIMMATSFTPVVNTKYIFFMEFVGDGTSDKLYINGTAITMDSGNAGATPLAGSLRIGHPTAGAHAWIGDHFTYNGIFSSGDRADIIDELKTKYGIA